MNIIVNKGEATMAKARSTTGTKAQTPVVEVSKIRVVKDPTGCLAFVDIIVDNAIVIKGFKILEGERGNWVGMPQKLGKDGKYYDQAFAVDREVRERIVEVILDAYERAVTKAPVAETAKA